MSSYSKLGLLWAAHKTVPTNWRVPTHRHDYWQAVCVLHGTILFTLGAEQRRLQRAECVLIRSLQPHSFRSTERSELLEAKFVVYSEQLLAQLALAAGFVGTVCPEAVGALQRVVVEGERRAPFYEEISRSAAEEFLWYLCRNSAGSAVTMHPERRHVPPYPSHVEALPQRRGVTRDIIAQVVCFMEKHLSDDLTLVGLGRHFGYHPTYLCEKFAASVGQPPIQFLTELRIRRAQSLLAHSELSIRAIASAVGYKSEQHFSRVFKKRTGLSPYRFRLTQRTRCREICFVDEATATAYGLP